MKFFCALFILSICRVSVEANFTINTGPLDWWQTSVIYQVYPRSFKDSNSDGKGDLKGIEEKADYLKDLGVGAVWLSPIFKSPFVDLGYDISDFKAIDPSFGSMSDFESLRDKLQTLGMKLILDFVPNHSSDQHEWFKKSVQKIDPYTDYYIWKDPKGWINETTPIPPNNWRSAFSQGAWSYNQDRKQFYLHHFAVEQPDLNYRSKELLEEMKNVIRFWLDKRVDGFRMDTVPHLVEDENFPDQEISRPDLFPSYGAYDSTYTQNRPETYDVLRQFREVVDSYKQKDGHTRLILTEAYANQTQTLKYYGNITHPISHVPFNFFLLKGLKDDSTALEFQQNISSWIDNMPEGAWPNWVLGNHDNLRIADRFDSSSVDSLNILLLLLPGTAITYNGEEIGMEGMKIRYDQTQDVSGKNLGEKNYNMNSRDPERTPFQWDSSDFAGFSNTNQTTWLPVNPNYYTINVEAQKNDPTSHYNIYKNLIKLRSNEVFRRGDLKTFVASERVFAFARSLKNETYLTIMNVNNVQEIVDIKNTIADVSGNFKVALASGNSEHKIGSELSTSSNKIKMRPKSAIVLQMI